MRKLDLVHANEYQLIRDYEEAHRHYREIAPKARAYVPGQPLVLDRVDWPELRLARESFLTAQERLYRFWANN